MTAPRVWLERARIRDFRNIERVDLQLDPAGVAIVGENAQGKTNLLEALYYLQVLRSARGAGDPEMVRFGARGFHVTARMHADAPHELGAGFDLAGRRKRFTSDGVVIERLSDALGSLPSVMFSPRDVQLVSGGPAERRRYLDVVLALTSKRYLRALQTYRAGLARRNAALRAGTASRRNADAVSAWEPAMAGSGAIILEERIRWVERMGADFAQLSRQMGEEGISAMAYQSTADGNGSSAGSLAQALERSRARDARRGFTHIGPHRDDLQLTLAGRDLRSVGSAGQQRTAAIALRMLESATLRESVGHEPLLLLDDPFAELDLRRSSRILHLLEHAGIGQVILAVPREGDIPPELVRLDRARIHAGSVGSAAA